MSAPALSPIRVSSPAHCNKAETWVVSLLCFCAPLVACIFLSPVQGWLFTAGCMFLFVLFLGRWITSRPLGVFVNERNLMSLSRFQMIAWTILLLSAFFSVAAKRLYVLSVNREALPLNIAMDWRLWALMGISATSLVGSPLILSVKSSQEATAKSVEKTASALNETADSIQQNSHGILYSNSSVRDASPADMFQGDDVEIPPT